MTVPCRAPSSQVNFLPQSIFSAASFERVPRISCFPEMAAAEGSMAGDDWEDVGSDDFEGEEVDDLSAADIAALEAEVAALKASEEQDGGQQGGT